MAPSLSLTQVNYTAAGLVASPPNRLDGRDLLAFRPLQIATGISGQAAGSAQCTLGGTRCLVVISAEVVQDDEAQSGLIECSVDVDPSVPLSANLSALLLTLQKSLGHALTSSAIRPAQLVILRSASPPHRPTRAWKLTMDVSLQDVSGGNVADTTFAAAYAALADVRLPRTRAIGFDVAGLQGERQTEGQGHQNMDIFDVRGSLSRTRGGLKGAGVKAGADATVEEASDDGKIGVDFEIQDVWDGAVKLEGADSFPIGVTVNVLPDGVLLDATQTEEACIPYTRRILVLCNALSAQIVGTQMLTASFETGATRLGEERPLMSGTHTSHVTPDVALSGTCDYKTVRTAIRQGQSYAQGLHAAIEAQLGRDAASIDRMQAD